MPDQPIDPFPLGKPLNRKPPPGLVPVPNRPGWWRDPRTGIEIYVEPPRAEPTLYDIFGVPNPNP